MMASNLLSRLLPSASDERVQLDRLPTQHRRSSSSDEPHGMDIDQENLEARFEDQDLENLLADAASSHITTESTAFSPPSANNQRAGQPATGARGPPTWRQSAPPPPTTLYDDDDVPESLLLEGGAREPLVPKSSPHRGPTEGLPPPVPGPSTRQTRAQWEATRRHQRLHDDDLQGEVPVRSWGVPGKHTNIDPKQRALWRWVNVSDLDTFLQEVYTYYNGYGMYSILLRRILTLLQTGFVVAFITFLVWCIDYPKISHSQKMSQVIVAKCTKKMHGFWVFALWLFIGYWIWSCVQIALEYPHLKAMHDFYHHLLDIPDRDIQTVQWQHVVARIMALRDQNLTTATNLSPEARKVLDHKSRQRLDAIDIASRLMRRENYLIALFNKDVLDVAIPVPFLGTRYFFSETTNWHVQLAILDFVFSGPNNTFNTDFLRVANRRELVRRLQSRCFYTGVISIIYAPFTVTFVLASYLFKYFTEYHKDPSQLGSRDFTTFAQWKFREFNELPHLFNRRRNMAYPWANLYLAQFPKDKTEQISAFVAFVAGAFAFVLLSVTFLDSELFLAFEITPGKTAIFWITVLTGIYRTARSSSPQNDQVADPAYYLGHVNDCTRYEPDSWKDRLHSDEVRAEFAKLYQPKILIFAEEILSMVITPFILMFRLPQCSERIVDFFREFSIVVDGLGVVCSYSMFPFNKNQENNTSKRPNRDEPPDLREDYFKTKDDKMLKSYYGFMDAYNMGAKQLQAGARAPFHPPPQFPNTFGNMSQTAHPQPEFGGAAPSARGNSRGPTASRQPLHSHSYQPRTPRHGPTSSTTAFRDNNNAFEPINSILLDPHHQPSSSGIRASPRQLPLHANPRYRSSLQTVNDTATPPPAPPPPGFSRQNSSRIEEESEIGESWRTSRLAQGDDEEEEDQEGGRGARGGVLQLLQQFSKAQTEGRTGGVGI